MFRKIAISAAALIGLAGCDAETMEAISQGLAQGAYESQYYGTYGNGYTSPYSYGSGYGFGGTSYRPNTFANGYWPQSGRYGTWVGRYGCTTIGSMYSCDSNGDGYVDMWGDTSDGSYSSSTSRVNGRGEGFSWDSDCSCWERDRSLDGPYRGPRDDGSYRRRDRDRYDDDRGRDRDRYDD